jgi:phage minor structural protein
MNLTTVYDKQMNLLAYLENATAINVSTPTNELHKAGFTLPYDDPKTQHCKPFNRVRLYDNTGDEIGLFRIMKNKITKNGEKLWEFKLEHVLATLIDPSLPGYHQIDNQTTTYNIEYLLSFQYQQDWVLGDVEFTRYFSYYWEEENGIYNALKSITEPFGEPFIWDFDTSVYPWVLHLRVPSFEPKCRIRGGYNMQGITKEEDPTKVITKIRPLGYSEGVNTLTIASVNNGDEWLTAEQTYIDQYGEVEYIHPDKRYRNADSLKAFGQAMLDEYKIPPVTYTIDAADVYEITGLPIDKFTAGDIVEVTDPDLGTFNTRIMNVKKNDLKGQPGQVGLELSRKVKDIGDGINDINRKQRVHDVYAQGATNLYANDYADNADATHPAKIRFFIPQDAVKINSVHLNYEVEAFRAYSKAIKSGGSSTQTSTSGGGVSKSTASGGGSVVTSASGGNHSHLMHKLYDSTGVQDPGTFYGYYGRDSAGVELSGYLPWYPADVWTHGASGDHTHSIDLPLHSHSFSTPDHAHDVSIPSHSHGIDYGIYENSTAPTSVTLKVDGNTVSGAALNENDFDIVPFMTKDSSGRITRGTWHTVEITPNTLGRVSLNLITQIFIQSRGKYTV